MRSRQTPCMVQNAWYSNHAVHGCPPPPRRGGTQASRSVLCLDLGARRRRLITAHVWNVTILFLFIVIPAVGGVASLTTTVVVVVVMVATGTLVAIVAVAVALAIVAAFVATQGGARVGGRGASRQTDKPLHEHAVLVQV